jgi:hypothetical protein
VAENEEVIFSICHIWLRDVIDDVARKGRAEAVIRGSSERRLVAVYRRLGFGFRRFSDQRLSQLVLFF